MNTQDQSDRTTTFELARNGKDLKDHLTLSLHVTDDELQEQHKYIFTKLTSKRNKV
jgi:hypothetical protein